jgi:luciferase family oxidoreductase group 1
MVRLSVLDLFPIVSGTACSQSIQESLALARRVDELGYARYWVAEHHNSAMFATTSPEVLIAHVAATTRRMRVGAGGMMLPNHSPLRIVETFRMLAAIYPGRIDLGLGRALGADPVTSSALRRRPDGDDVDAQLAELCAFATRGFPEGHPFASIEAVPSDVELPPIWMLGSSREGAAVAASLGVGFAFAGHLNLPVAQGAIEAYRSQFKPSAAVPEPRLIITIWVVCGETDAEAEELAKPLRVGHARMSTGVRGPFPTPAEAREHELTMEQRAVVHRLARVSIVGGPERVGAELDRLARDTGADEIMIVSVLSAEGERVRSYERVAKLAGLPLSPHRSSLGCFPKKKLSDPTP